MRYWISRITLLALGLALITTGVLRTELPEIMRKATVVCLECIGIG